MNKLLKLFWIACGKADNSEVPNQKALMDSMDRHSIRYNHRWTEGEHTWTNWRSYLRAYLQLLFVQ